MPDPTRAPRRLGPRGRRVFDVALVVALLAPVAAFPVAGVAWSQTALAVAMVLPLLWRRTHPGTVFAVVVAAHVVQALATDTPMWGQVALPVAVFSLARYAGWRAGAIGLAVGLAGAVWGAVDWLAGYDVRLAAGSFLPYFLPMAAIVTTAWALGTLARTRAAYVGALVERAEQLEREAAQQVALAAQEERARIARELHDVVAHGLSVIVVQADGARYAAARDPAQATGALERIAGTGREALTDMRQLLGLLREEDSGGPPLPGVADLPALLDGVPATLEGTQHEVPAAVGLTAYRVAQEALTNVRKHAGPGAAPSVRVRVAERAVELEVDDAGRGAATQPGAGHGLTGMRERIAVHDGELVAGPRPGGGWRVHAVIPW